MIVLDDIITEAMAHVVRRAPRLIWLSLATKLACQSVCVLAATSAPFEHEAAWAGIVATDMRGTQRRQAALFRAQRIRAMENQTLGLMTEQLARGLFAP